MVIRDQRREQHAAAVIANLQAEFELARPRSREHHERAVMRFHSGVTHDGRYLEPFQLAIARAEGAYKWDADGNRYIDYVTGHGSLILGHSHPAVVEAVTRQVALGTHLGGNHALEVAWAERVSALVPGAERVRFVSSGTEATMLAIAREMNLSETAFVRRSVVADFGARYFTPAEHPGLAIFPYHRLVHNLPKRRLTGMMKKLEANFIVERALVSPFNPGNARRDFMSGLEERGGRGPSFALLDGAAGEAWRLTLRPEARLDRECRTEADAMLRSLDVVILEELVLTGILGIKHKDLLNEKYVSYETDYDRIIDAVQQPPHQVAFLLNPTPVGKVLGVADLAGVMPEKSTYFFPKVATGLVMNSFED